MCEIVGHSEGWRNAFDNDGGNREDRAPESIAVPLLMKTVLKVLRRVVEWLAVILVAIVLLRAIGARRLPDLKPWHRVVPQHEVTAAELTDRFTLDQYRAREDEIWKEIRERVESQVPAEDCVATNRYYPGARNNPDRFPTDWNHTFELVPGEIRGGALLVHGLTDSPYSMRRVAQILRDQGIYALCLRVPAHGTVPAALTTARWEDWSAAVRVGARHVRQKIGDGKPFYLVGYSNGGALVLKYSLDVLKGAPLPRADRIVLLSPMIGVTPYTNAARIASMLAFVPYFEKSRWLDIVPEYIPFKYNSFPVNAGRQTLRLTGVLQAEIQKAAGDRTVGKLPPILTFQSLVDSTISTEAIVDKLYAKLADNESELVLFDVNRSDDLKPYFKNPQEDLLARTSAGQRQYAFTLITNAHSDTMDVVTRSFPKAGGPPRDTPLNLSWPRQLFSLSHVALPFAPDDPLYGTEPDMSEDYGVRVGQLAPRGERSVIRIPMDAVMRLTCNPFFPYMARRISDWLGGAGSTPAIR
jgi:alpha-beta hydrolase superfamily lysophospholipase